MVAGVPGPSTVARPPLSEVKSTSVTANIAETSTRVAVGKRKLSYLEAREYATLEDRICEAEQALEARRAALLDPSIASDGPRLLAVSGEIERAQAVVDALYSRWAELEEKQAGSP